MPAFRSHSTDTVTTAWDGPANKTNVRSGEDRAYYAKIFAWYDPDLDEGNKGTYKFIHHEVASGGEPGAANTNGCSAGIGVLNGGRGGTTIPDADRQGVYDHLAKHVRDAGLEPPELSGRIDSTQSYEAPLGVMSRIEIVRQAAAEPWAILPSALQQMIASAGLLQAEHDAPIVIEAVARPGPKSGRVVRIPITGAIVRRDSLWSKLFGGTSIEFITKALRDVAADDSISTVVLDIDSPGGTVSGMPELAGEVRSLRQGKHVVALANSLTASAAYWIASQADEIVATPEALVGSVGVFAVHEDWSKFMEQHGVKMTYIAAGKYKTEGNFDEPLSDEARAHMQTIVDDAYDLFVGDVARGRGVLPKIVRAEYGEGRVLTARAAKDAGMIDRVAGAEETLQRLTGRRAEEMDSRQPHAGMTDNRGNSLAAKRRRLEIAEKIFTEE